MSRKHYVAFARILRETHASRETVEAVCDLFAADNSRFDRGRFMAAVRGDA